MFFFGTIGKFFNFETVINAIRDNNELKQINFVLCGNGSKKDYYQSLAAGLKNVFFPGWVNRDQIISLMNKNFQNQQKTHLSHTPNIV